MSASAKSDTPRTLLQVARNAVLEFFAPCGWARLDRLERELTAARAEAEALRKDAERYRRIRENWIDCDELELHGRLSVIDAAIDQLRKTNEA